MTKQNTVHKLEIKYRKISELIPYINNAKLHPEEQVNQIAASIKEFQMNDPIAIDGDNGIISGHGRLQACMKLKIKEVPTIELSHLSEIEKKAYIIAHNKLTMNSGFDMEMLANELSFLDDADFDLSLTGFDDDELEALLFEEVEGLTDEDEVPDVPDDPISKLGDVWLLGDHHLMCGDSTDAGTVALLMNGVKADLCLTDPPYNLGFKYNSYKDDKSYNEYKSFCESWFENIKNSSVNQIITSGKQNFPMWCEIERPISYGTWYAKNKMSGDKISNLALTEPILFYGKFNRNSRANDFYSYNVRQQKDTGGHTCPKLVEFFEDLIKSYSIQSVMDIFGGSGTTLIACEKTGRKCYMMELDPVYCDVIRTRWENYTGKKAVLENNEIVKKKASGQKKLRKSNM